jgi:hypothetical protein
MSKVARNRYPGKSMAERLWVQEAECGQRLSIGLSSGIVEGPVSGQIGF